MNRRLAEHKNRKGLSIAKPAVAAEPRYSAGSRAAQAAARVAARYAKAPSYSEMLAEDARAAVRAAEAASRAALEAQSAAEFLLDGLEAAANGEFSLEAETAFAAAPQQIASPAARPAAEQTQPVAPTPRPAAARSWFGICWNSDLPARPAEPAAARAVREVNGAELSAEDWRQRSQGDFQGGDSQDIEVVEPDIPIHANLIEFPRELVATRKVRPRRAEGPLLGSADPLVEQLSIFEVELGAISIEPAPTDAVAASSAPEWSGMELAAHPIAETEPEGESAPVLHPARMNRRLLAAMVDSALIVAVVLAAAAGFRSLLPVKEIELGALAALAVIGALYQTLFFTFAEATPGMMYARVSLCTFDDQKPTPAQLRGRLGALLLSLAPVGLGVLWILFDDDRLSWHDRLSRTYQREC